MLLSWSMELTITLVVLVAYLVYKYFIRNFNHWKDQGVFYFKPTPFFGNFSDSFTLKMNFVENLNNLYKKTTEPFFGAFLIDRPILVIKSPELVKNIMVKDFTYFKDRSMACPQHNDMIANFLVFQKYREWRKTHLLLTPTFSSGKLKAMFHTVVDLQKLTVEYGNKHSIVDCKVFCHMTTTELMARCFFGIDGRCFTDEQSSAFLKISKRLFEFSIRNAFIQGLYVFKPDWVNLLRLDFLKRSDQNYLLNAIEESVKARRKARNPKIMDYIDIMLELKENDKKSDDKSMTDYMLAKANTLQFFVAGEETTSGLLAFTLYEWAIHPDIQQKCREEVLDILQQHGKFTFENLLEMEYLQLCLNETNRKYFSLPVLDRTAVEDYKVPGIDFVIKKGTDIYIPYYSLHMDEKYFPEPEKYIPERFSNGVNEESLYYVPFGAGPKACIGERFAKMAAKITLGTLITKFKFVPCDGTPNPVKLEPRSFTFQSDVPLLVQFVPIEAK